MPQTLNSLEAQRSTILQQFLSLGDLRPGSITAVVRSLRQAFLPLCQTQRPWTRSADFASLASVLARR